MSKLRTVRVSRRGLLQAGLVSGGALAAGAITSCSSSGEVTVGSDEATGAANAQHALLAAFPQSVPHLGVGVPNRMPYLVSDPEGVPLADLVEPVIFTVKFGDEIVEEDIEIEPRSDSIPRAYVPLEINFPELGFYEITATYQGSKMDSQVQAYSPDEIAVPLVGSPLASAPTPTPETPLDVDPICTRVPACEFHENNLADVLTAGKKIALLVSTPAYCQTAVCGPILDNLIDLASDRDDLIPIHAEVYADPKEVTNLVDARLAPVPDVYRMVYEPALFVTDEQGTLTARADVIVDKSEMEELIA